MPETQMWFQSSCVKYCLSIPSKQTHRILSLDKHRWYSDSSSEWESRNASSSFRQMLHSKLLNRMFVFCFIAKAESSLAKECSEVSGMEHVGGPVVFPHLVVNFKQKNERKQSLTYVCHNSYLYHKNDLQILLLSLSK